MMDKLMMNLEPVILSELHEANNNYPLFQSQHEGVAVIREEVEEAQQSMGAVLDHWKSLWHDVKADNYDFQYEDIDYLRESAKNLAGEAVQICAMCDKWGLSTFFGKKRVD